jgi:hypothetical protein
MLTVKPPVAVFNVNNECTANPFYRKFIDASYRHRPGMETLVMVIF